MKIIKLIINFFKFFNLKRRKNLFKEVETKKLLHNQDILDINIRTIRNYSEKFNALIFKEKFSAENGFRLIYSKGFNSFGFKERVDIVICDIKNQVIETYSNFPPNKLTKYYNEAYCVFVLADNMNKFLNVNKKDLLKVLN